MEWRGGYKKAAKFFNSRTVEKSIVCSSTRRKCRDLDCIVFDLEGNPKAILEYRRYSFKGTSRPKDWFREWNGGSYTIARQIFKVAELLKIPLFVVLREEIAGTLIGICKPEREGGYKDLVFVSEEEYQDWLRWLVEQ